MPYKITVPTTGTPIVRELLQAMRDHSITYQSMEEKSGICMGTIHGWRRGHVPVFSNIEACLNVVGLTLVTRKLEEE